MSIHVIFPKPETSDPNTQKQLQSLKFSAATRRIPLLFFWIFMGLAVFVTGCLAHNRSSWQAFWNQEAVLDRRWALKKVPLGIFFDSITTDINKLFVKGGWIVAGVIIIAVQAFYISLVVVRRDRVPALQFLRNLRIGKMVAIEAAVLILSTFYFIICTWIFNRIADETGSCTSSDSFSFPVSKKRCQSVFRGFDISGHCFLIVHSCLLALEYAAKLLFVWRAKESKPTSDKDSDVESVVFSEDELPECRNLHEITPKSNDKFNRNYLKYQIILISLFSLVFLLCLSEFFVFLQTILFYHTVLEKILGTLIGAGFWITLFILSQKYPHLF
jgi:hypothetical protein